MMKLAEYCLCGSIQTRWPIYLRRCFNRLYANDDGNWCSVTFPGVQLAHLQQPLSICSVASFGVGGEEVTEQTRHDALKLDRKRLFLHPWDAQLLGTIQHLMIPDIVSIYIHCNGIVTCLRLSYRYVKQYI